MEERLSMAGRPAKFETPEDMQQACIDYFTYIQGEWHEEDIKDSEEKRRVWDRYPEAPSVTGLALFLGFESRQSMYDYGNKPEFSYIVKRAKLLVENGYERTLMSDKPTGAIFALKNMGWVDRTELDHTSNGKTIASPTYVTLTDTAPPLTETEYDELPS